MEVKDILTIVGEHFQFGRGLDGVPGSVLHHTLVHRLVPAHLHRFDPENGAAGDREHDEASVDGDSAVVLAPLYLGFGVPCGAAGEGRHTVTPHPLVPRPLLELRRVCRGREGKRRRELVTDEKPREERN